MDLSPMQCPFVYAKGHRCSGGVYQVRAYGPQRGSSYITLENVRKFRLWCSEKGDHAGAISDSVSKERMEFYLDGLRRLGIHEQVALSCEEIEPMDKRWLAEQGGFRVKGAPPALKVLECEKH